MDRDAVVAQSNRANDLLPRQCAAAAPQAVFQALQPHDRARIAMGGGGRGGRSGLLPLGRHRAGQLLIALHRHRRGGEQAKFLAQAVERLVQGHPTEADGGQQIIRAHKVAAAGHLGHRLTVEQGIKTVAAQLPLQHRRAAQDVLLTVALLVPLADAIARRGGGNKI